MDMDRDLVKLQGFWIDSFTMDEAVNYAANNCGQIVTINPEMIAFGKKDKDFAHIINTAQLVVPDGIGVEIGLKLLGHKVKRIPGIELGKALIIKFSKENKKIAFIGAKPQIAELAVKKLQNELQNINTVYIHDGYFENDDDIITELTKAEPDLILVALGSPKQEFFINKIKSKLPNSVMIGLGGSFDVWAGVVPRAPKIYQNLGLEWLYRTIKEPKRLNRIFPTLPVFVINVLKERLFGL